MGLSEFLGGASIRSFERVTGGMICESARVETSDGTLFLKWKEKATAGFFIVEAKGLELLRQTGTLRVPEVVACRDRGDEVEAVHGPSFLALEWIESTPVEDR